MCQQYGLNEDVGSEQQCPIESPSLTDNIIATGSTEAPASTEAPVSTEAPETEGLGFYKLF